MPVEAVCGVGGHYRLKPGFRLPPLEPGPWVISASAEILIRVATAIRERRRIAFEYQSHNGARSTRQSEPCGLAHLDGRWYRAGRCLLRHGLRTFRLDRTTHLELLDKPFTPPAGFDIKAYLNGVMPFVESAYQVQVWLNLPLSEAKARFPLHRIAMEEEQGSTTLPCGRDALEPFAAMLLSPGCEICVRQPEKLREVFMPLSRRASRAGGQLQDLPQK